MYYLLSLFSSRKTSCWRAAGRAPCGTPPAAAAPAAALWHSTRCCRSAALLLKPHNHLDNALDALHSPMIMLTSPLISFFFPSLTISFLSPFSSPPPSRYLLSHVECLPTSSSSPDSQSEHGSENSTMNGTIDLEDVRCSRRWERERVQR